jgi:glycosyltransferase involved in cell wall biosynthesis
VDSLYAKVDTPYVLLEAMALGRPVIVSNLPPLQELAALGDGSIVVPKGDPEATAEAMARLAADPDDAARLGESARATIAHSFSLTRMARAYETLYDELLTRHGR